MTLRVRDGLLKERDRPVHAVRYGSEVYRERRKARKRDERLAPAHVASRGPQETAQVGELIKQLKAEGIGIFLISHDIHDVFDLADRISVMLHGRLVGTVNKSDVTTDEVLAMIIMGKLPTEVTQTELAQLHS